MYKVQINISPTYIANLFITNTRRYALRNSDFTIPRFNRKPNYYMFPYVRRERKTHEFIISH